MGNCIAQPNRSESGQRHRGVPRERFLRRFCRCVRRHRAEVGVEDSSPADMCGPTEGSQTAAVQSLPGVSVRETPLIKPVKLDMNKVGPCKHSSSDRNTPCQNEELPRHATVTSLFSAVSSLVVLNDSASKDEAKRVGNIADHLDAESEEKGMQEDEADRIDKIADHLDAESEEKGMQEAEAKRVDNIADHLDAESEEKGMQEAEASRIDNIADHLGAESEEKGMQEAEAKRIDNIKDHFDAKSEEKHLQTTATEGTHIPLCTTVSSRIATFEDDSDGKCTIVTESSSSDDNKQKVKQTAETEHRRSPSRTRSSSLVYINADSVQSPVDNIADHLDAESEEKDTQETDAKPVDDIADHLDTESDEKDMQDAEAKPVDNIADHLDAESEEKGMQEAEAKPVDNIADHLDTESEEKDMQEAEAKPVDNIADHLDAESGEKGMEEVDAKRIDSIADRLGAESEENVMQEANAKRIDKIVDHLDAKSEEEDLQTTTTENSHIPLCTTVSSRIATFEDDSDGICTIVTESSSSDGNKQKVEQTPETENRRSPSRTRSSSLVDIDVDPVQIKLPTIEDDEMQAITIEESKTPLSLCTSVSSLVPIYKEDSGHEVTGNMDDKPAETVELVNLADQDVIKQTTSSEHANVDESIPNMCHLSYPKLPRLVPKNVDPARSYQNVSPGQVETKQDKLELIQNEPVSKFVNEETGTIKLVGEEVIERLVQEEHNIPRLANTEPLPNCPTGLPNDCTHGHTSESPEDMTEGTQIPSPSTDYISKKKKQTHSIDKDRIFKSNLPDISKTGKETPASGQPYTIVFDSGKISRSPIEENVSLTVKGSLELIKAHAKKKDCEFPLYVRSPGGNEPRLVRIKASRKQIKDGSAKRLILQSKSLTKDSKDQGPIDLEKKKSKKHIGCQPGIVAFEEESCHRWKQKEGTCADARTSPVPQFYESQGVKQNAREKMGLERLQKYQITIQCTAIERIKADENEFPGILPERLRNRWKKKMSEQKAHMIN